MEDAKDLEALVVDLIKRDNVNVPPYPVVAMRLQRLVNNEDWGISDIQRVIGGDPVLAATVLRYANSAAFRGVAATTTLESSITRIGAKEVCKIALATSIGAHAIVTGCLSPLRRRYWRQAMTSAMLCRALAYWRKENPEEAFVCGLLHDFGQVIAAACLEEVITRTKDARVLPEAEWHELVERFHVELGLVTAARWNLPPLICAVITSHHDPGSNPQYQAMIDIVNACDAVANHLDQETSPSAQTLASLSVLPADEPPFLMTVIPKVASEVAALDETTPGKDTGIFRIGSRMLQPHSLLTEPIKRATLKMQIIRATGNVVYETQYVARDGLGFVGTSKLRENSMVRIRVETPRGDLEGLGVIVLCAAEGTASRMELKLFAADTETLQSWMSFYGSVP